jgi:hypothetical protein
MQSRLKSVTSTTLPGGNQQGAHAAETATIHDCSATVPHKVDGIKASDAIHAKVARWIIKAREVRSHILGAHIFADPAWDILLELYALTCEGRRVSVSKLSMVAGVPSTTALRWIDKLESERLLVRTDDPLDARRVWITLSQCAHSGLHSFIDRLSRQSVGV